MPQTPVTLPSGLAGLIRGFKTKEANILADSTNKDGTSLENIVASCWLETRDPGPYKLDAQARLAWSTVLSGDRLVALIEARINTYGSAYSFQLQCRSEDCRKKFPWDVDLRRDFPVRPYPEAALKALVENDGRFPVKLPGGRAATAVLMTGSRERLAAERRKKVKQEKKARSSDSNEYSPGSLTLALHTRLVEINGIDGNDKMAFIDDMDLGDLNEIIGLLDEMEGGIDTKMEVECGECGLIQDVSLPFGKEFFMPPRKTATPKNKT